MWTDKMEKRAAEMKARNESGGGRRRRGRFVEGVQPVLPESPLKPIPPSEPEVKKNIRYFQHDFRNVELKWHRLSMGELDEYGIIVLHPGERIEATYYFGSKIDRVFGTQTWTISEDHQRYHHLKLDGGDVVVELVNWKLYRLTFIGKHEQPCWRCDAASREPAVHHKRKPCDLCDNQGVVLVDFESVCVTDSTFKERCAVLRPKYCPQLNPFLGSKFEWGMDPTLPWYSVPAAETVTRLLQLFQKHKSVYSFEEKVRVIPVVLEDEHLTDAGLHEVGKEMSRRLFPDSPFNEHPTDVSIHGEDFHSDKYREFCRAVLDAIFREQERRRTRAAQTTPPLAQ